jgi:hypothetical protein
MRISDSCAARAPLGFGSELTLKPFPSTETLLKRHVLTFLPLIIGIANATPAHAQELFVYPSRGQDAKQQDRDRYECHNWAVGQSGYDPSRAQASAPAQTTSEVPRGGLMRGAARGAAVGAVGGAIGGDAGKGAAIGAASGALIGGIRRRDQLAGQAAEQSSNAAAKRDGYDRALRACLQGRGYTVN